MATIFNTPDPYAGAASAMQGLLGSLGQAIQREQLIDSLPENDPRRNLIRGLPVKFAQQKVAGSMLSPLEEEAAKGNIQLAKARSFSQLQTAVKARQTQQFTQQKEDRARAAEVRAQEDQRMQVDKFEREREIAKRKVAETRQAQLSQIDKDYQDRLFYNKERVRRRAVVLQGHPNAKALAKAPSPGPLSEFQEIKQNFRDMGELPKVAHSLASDVYRIRGGLMPHAKTPEEAIDRFEQFSRIYRNAIANIDFSKLETDPVTNKFIYPSKVQKSIDYALIGMHHNAEQANKVVQAEIDKMQNEVEKRNPNQPQREQLNLEKSRVMDIINKNRAAR